ncbi:MAG: MiaB/RimO family radical SAM methylthiotransferase, partial [Planctomycetaceae bacterium]|nr:MiaB/RimO family radical SAM methylthiotransferase [Planctomycetaceae bacterium]
PANDIVIPQRERLTEKHIAYLRIADGCNRRCTFCAIPDIRGNFRSVPLEALLAEAKRLANSGVQELILIAQETTFWGTDIYGQAKLAELLRQLEKIDGLRWIRLMYSYPQYFDDELIDLFAAGGKLLPYIDIPLQHCSDEILKKMNRRVHKTETEQLLEKLRSRIPNLILRTSLIVGFPGETEAMFTELLRFVEQWKFERAGVFRFSPEKGTPAAKFENRVQHRLLDRRYESLYKHCEKFSIAWAARQKGNTMNVQIDGNYIDDNGRKESNLFVGRTFADAPDIDPVVYVTVEKPADDLIGALIPCEILETEGCDLVGIPAT